MRKLYVFFIVFLIISLMFEIYPLFAGGKKEEAVEEEVAAPTEWKEKESPLLHEMVMTGTLPPLERRLPKNPKLVKPQKEIGKYGGTLDRGSAFLMGDWIPLHLTMESLFAHQWPFPNVGPVESNLADEWSYNEEGTELTVHLREGIKWSDGEPFTSEDILFYWEDVCLNENSFVNIDPNLLIDGELPELQIIDNYNIKFIFPKPFFFSETVFASMLEIAWPKHYMKQFHPDYNREATWDIWNDNLLWLKGRGRVTLQAWMLGEFVPDDHFTMTRNPYYWKVDLDGNQLPYIDRITFHLLEDRQTIALKNVSGELDIDAMWVGIQHLSLFLVEKDKRDFSVGYANVPGMAMFFNYDTVDKVQRKIMRDLDFRRAFSLAINRNEIGKVMFYDQLQPSGWTFSPNSAYYDQETGRLYSEYNPEKAKELLDNAGFIDIDGDGIRELPTGEDVELIVDVAEHDLYVPIVEMVVDYLTDVGVKLVMNVQAQDLIEQRRNEDTWHIHVWDLYACDEPLAGLQKWVPVAKNQPFWHKNAYQSPFSPTYKQYSELMLKAKSLPYEERIETVKKANRLQAENIFAIHIGFYRRPFIYSNKLGNVPKELVRITEFGAESPPQRTLQLYFKYGE